MQNSRMYKKFNLEFYNVIQFLFDIWKLRLWLIMRFSIINQYIYINIFILIFGSNVIKYFIFHRKPQITTSDLYRYTESRQNHGKTTYL